MSHYKPDPNKSVNLFINGIPVTVPEGTRILEAAREAGVQIPTLCDHPDLCKRALCRLCVVEAEGSSKLMAACANDVWEGAKVVTNSSRLLSIRKMIVELLLANHPKDCLTCIRNKDCQLQSLAEIFGIRESTFRHDAIDQRPPVPEGNALVRDIRKCVKCGRCVEVCQEVQTARAINTSHRGMHFEICVPYGQSLTEGPCIFCGQCAEVCPVGALYEHDQTAEARTALNDKDRHVAALISPSLGISGALGLCAQSQSAGKMVTALKSLGFKKVYNADFSADLAMKEASRDILDRIKTQGKLPLITCGSPGMFKFVESSYPNLAEHLGIRKTPMQMLGTFVKNQSRESGVDISKVTIISVMPGIAEKFELANGLRDVDLVLTAKELARMIKLAGIDFASLPETPFDAVSGEKQEWKTMPLHDKDGVKETEVELAGNKVKALSVFGLANARAILDSVSSGECKAALVEISG